MPVLFEFYFISPGGVARAMAFTPTQIQRQNPGWSSSDSCGLAGCRGCASLVRSGWGHGWEVGLTWLTQHPEAFPVKQMTAPGPLLVQIWDSLRPPQAAPAARAPTPCFNVLINSPGGEAVCPRDPPRQVLLQEWPERTYLRYSLNSQQKLILQMQECWRRAVFCMSFG